MNKSAKKPPNFHSYIQNLPIYEVGKPLELVMREYNIAPQDIIKLGSNENPLGTSPIAKEAILQNAHLANVYPDDSYFELKDSLLRLYNIESKHIIIGSGSDQIIEFCIHAMCDESSSVLTAKTTFAMYEIYARHYNASVIKTQDFFHNLDSMLRLYKEHKPSIIFICTPNNPLGEALKREAVLDFIKQIDDKTLVVLDCAYMEYCEHKDSEYFISPSAILSFSNVIYLGTFSKIYALGGMRVGYGIANEEIISTLHKLRSPFNITTLGLKAATASLKDKGFLQKSLQNNAKEMQRYKDFFKEYGEQYGFKILESYANFVTFLLNQKLDSSRIALLLLQEGIVVRGLSGYGLNAIRITIGTARQNDIVLQKLLYIIKLL